MEEFNDRVEELRKNRKNRIKARYRFARNLGFCAEEASLLQNNSEEVILNIKEYRVKKKGAKVL